MLDNLTLTDHHLFLIAGETSGDVRAASLCHQLSEIEPGITFSGAGGQAMQKAGVELVSDMAREGVVGLWEVMSKLEYFSRSYRQILSEIRQRDPDAVVLVDFPGFNLKMAEQLHREGIPIIYYISPQVWAWRKGRIKKIKKVVDRMIVLFQFEEEMYQNHDVPVTWVGHPLVDEINRTDYGEELKNQLDIAQDEFTLGLLPGSRDIEFRRHYPPMQKAAVELNKKMDLHNVLVPVAPDLNFNKYKNKYDQKPYEHWFEGKSREVISASDLILTASGTTTLEAALLNTPMIVGYRVNLLTWAIGLPLMKTDHFALVNIVAGEELVPECLQWQMNTETLVRESMKLIRNEGLDRCQKQLSNIREKLGPPGASRRAAETVLTFLNSSSSR